MLRDPHARRRGAIMCLVQSELCLPSACELPAFSRPLRSGLPMPEGGALLVCNAGSLRARAVLCACLQPTAARGGLGGRRRGCTTPQCPTCASGATTPPRRRGHRTAYEATLTPLPPAAGRALCAQCTLGTSAGGGRGGGAARWWGGGRRGSALRCLACRRSPSATDGTTHGEVVNNQQGWKKKSG